MNSLGERIKKLRIEKGMRQQDFADKLFVTDKTVSSWECDRTTPDINMLLKIASLLETNLYSLISDNMANINELEIEVKIKISLNQYNSLLNKVKRDGVLIERVEQRDTYFVPKYRKFDKEWLRIRQEDGKNMITYKKKIGDGCCQELETLVDNYDKLEKIFMNLDMDKRGVVSKKRVKILYDNKYEIAFDEVDNLGYFMEIEVKRIDYDKKEELYRLIKLLDKLEIDTKMIDSRHYYDYLMGE